MARGSLRYISSRTYEMVLSRVGRTNRSARVRTGLLRSIQCSPIQRSRYFSHPGLSLFTQTLFIRMNSCDGIMTTPNSTALVDQYCSEGSASSEGAFYLVLLSTHSPSVRAAKWPVLPISVLKQTLPTVQARSLIMLDCKRSFTPCLMQNSGSESRQGTEASASVFLLERQSVNPIFRGAMCPQK
jgi:hypothetical protein